MSKDTITSIPATPTPETSGDSAGSATPVEGSEMGTQKRYNPIEFLSWARSVIKYSEIRGELFDITGIICCWQDYVLDAFHAELETMKAEGDLHLYGLDKPETLTDIEQEILQEVATVVREDIHRRLCVRKENQAKRATRANTAAAAKEKRLRRRLVVVYLEDNQDEISACKKSKAKKDNQDETSACKQSKAKKGKKSKSTKRTDGDASSHVPQTNTPVNTTHIHDPKGEKTKKGVPKVRPPKVDPSSHLASSLEK